MNLKDFIYVKENAFSKSDEIVEFANSLEAWQDSLVGSGRKVKDRTNSQVLLDKRSTKDPYKRALVSKHVKDIRHAFIKSLREYLEPHKKYCEVNQEEAFFVLKYNENEEYKAHSDGDTGKLNRRVSGLIYLNEDYRGGELHFPYADDLIIKPKKGMLVLFPSNFCYPHASLPITSGTKYCIVGWFK